MAKQSGLGDQLFIDGYDIGADISSIGSLSSPRETLPATDITQFAVARLFGKRDAQAEFVAYFDNADDASHEALRRLPTGDVQLMYLRGAGVGNEAYTVVAKQIDYAGTRGDDGSLLFNVSAQANAFGADWGRQLSVGKETFAGPADGASVDLGAPTAFGWQAYLQVFSIGSGTADVLIETSSDNGVGDPFAPLGGTIISSVSASGGYRFQSASDTAPVEQYVRLAVEGTFTNLVIAVSFTANRAQRSI